jgi:hypothetical protein
MTHASAPRRASIAKTATARSFFRSWARQGKRHRVSRLTMTGTGRTAMSSSVLLRLSGLVTVATILVFLAALPASAVIG